MKRFLYYTLTVILVGLVACSPHRGAEELGNRFLSDGEHLVLFAHEQRGSEVRVDVVLQGYPSNQHPRVMELFVRYNPETEFYSGEAGAGARSSGKEVVVQNPKEGLLRIVVYASGNTNPIDLGSIVNLNFHVPQGTQGRMEIVTDQPIFAPSAANEGLKVGTEVYFSAR